MLAAYRILKELRGDSQGLIKATQSALPMPAAAYQGDTITVHLCGRSPGLNYLHSSAVSI